MALCECGEKCGDLMHFLCYTYCNLVSRRLDETLGAGFFADRRSGSSPLRLYPVSWLWDCRPTFSTISLARPQHSWEQGPRKSHARARLHEVSSVQHSNPPTERLFELADDTTGPKYNDLKVGRNRRGSVTVVFILSFSEIREDYRAQ